MNVKISCPHGESIVISKLNGIVTYSHSSNMASCSMLAGTGVSTSRIAREEIRLMLSGSCDYSVEWGSAVITACDSTLRKVAKELCRTEDAESLKEKLVLCRKFGILDSRLSEFAGLFGRVGLRNAFVAGAITSQDYTTYLRVTSEFGSNGQDMIEIESDGSDDPFVGGVSDALKKQLEARERVLTAYRIDVKTT